MTLIPALIRGRMVARDFVRGIQQPVVTSCGVPARPESATHAGAMEGAQEAAGMRQ